VAQIKDTLASRNFRRSVLDLFGLPGAKHPTPVFEWQQLPEETRQMVTRQMVTRLTVHLLANHQRRDREPSSTGSHGDV
jgi:hypothetical protein